MSIEITTPEQEAMTNEPRRVTADLLRLITSQQPPVEFNGMTGMTTVVRRKVLIGREPYQHLVAMTFGNNGQGLTSATDGLDPNITRQTGGLIGKLEADGLDTVGRKYVIFRSRVFVGHKGVAASYSFNYGNFQENERRYRGLSSESTVQRRNANTQRIARAAGLQLALLDTYLSFISSTGPVLPEEHLVGNELKGVVAYPDSRIKVLNKTLIKYAPDTGLTT